MEKKHFHKNPLFFRFTADFEADNEINTSCLVDETTNVYKENPICNGYYIISELKVVLKSGQYKSNLDYVNVDWFVNEAIKTESKIAFYFKNTNKDIIVTEKDEEDYKSNNICRFC